MQILRKITIKSCGDFTIARIKAEIEKRKLADGGVVPLLRIVGDAASAKTGQTDKGTFTKLAGSFVGTDLLTGAVYQSGQCILPEFVGAQLGAALLSGGNVRFAFEIGAKRMDNAITGYEFTVTPLIETKPSEPVAELMKLAGIDPSKAPALPAPVDPAPAPAPAEPATKGRPRM